MFGCLIEYLIASYFGSMIFYFLIFIDTLFLRLCSQNALGKKLILPEALDANYASPFSYRIQVLFFKLCYWVANSCIIVSQSDLKNIAKISSLKKKLSYSEHAINTKLFFPDTQKEKLFTTVAWMGGEGNVKRKGVDKALRIFAELKKMPAFADFKFIIMGRKGEGSVNNQ